MAVIVNGDGILTGVSSLTTALNDITSGRGTITGVTTVGTLQLGAGVSISSPRSQNAAIFTNNTEFLTVDDAGRVGVGTVTPNSDAHPQNVGKINVGFITARSVAGDIDGNTLVVAGLSTFTDDVTFKGASGNITFDQSTDDLKFDDNNKVILGSGSDAQVFHNGSNLFIKKISSGTGQLYLDSEGSSDLYLRAGDGSSGTNISVRCYSNAGVDLRYQNIKRFETSPSGVDVTGTINATGVSTFVGNVSIGATIAENRLDVAGDLKLLDNSPRMFFHDLNATGAANATGGFETYDKDRNRAIYVGSINASNNIEFGTDNTERMRIDASGRLLVGTDASRQTRSGNSSYHPDVQLESAVAGLTIGKFNDSDGPARFVLQKARGSKASPTIVQDNDTLGQIIFSGWDGDTFTNSARITSEVEGTPGDDDMPGNLIFATTGDGASLPTERLRISAAGTTLIKGDANPCLSVDRGSANTTNINVKYNGTTKAQMSASSTSMEISSVGDIPMKFFANGSERMRLHSTGELSIPSGLTLGLQPDDKTASNTIHDYEEGTWQPTIADASGNDSTFGGTTAATYTKIGDTVRASFRCVNAQTSSLTGSDTFYVKGLPFTTVNRNYSTAWLRTFNTSNWGAAKCLIFAYIESNNIFFQGDSGANAGSGLKVEDLTHNQTDLFMTFVYQTTQ